NWPATGQLLGLSSPCHLFPVRPFSNRVMVRNHQRFILSDIAACVAEPGLASAPWFGDAPALVMGIGAPCLCPDLQFSLFSVSTFPFPVLSVLSVFLNSLESQISNLQSAVVRRALHPLPFTLHPFLTLALKTVCF